MAGEILSVPRFLSVCALLAAVGLIFWLDLLTGPELGLSLFYLMPVALGAWRHGRTLGVVLAVVAAGCWAGAEINGHPEFSPAIWLWNGITRLFIYSSMGFGIALIRADRERLKEALRRESHLAKTDALTGLANSRAFRELVTIDLARAYRDNTTVCLLYFDIDHFKRINDGYGHAEGDKVLTNIAGVIRSNLRAGDHGARLGGDEFAVLLWNTNEEQGATVADRVIQGVREIGKRYPNSELGASAGAAESGTPDIGPDKLLRAADRAMYQVKSASKGSVRRSTAPSAS